MNRRQALMTLFSIPAASAVVPEEFVSATSKTEVVITLDGDELKRLIAESLATAIERNDRGLRSRLRDGLGIEK